MKALAAIAAVAALAACASDPPRAASTAAPFQDAPGTIYAPRFAPAPSPRGVAPTPTPPVRTRVSAQASGPVGPVCGDPRIIGRALSAIKGRRAACGIANPVRVSSISGVALSAPIRVNCETAKATADWLDRGAIPAARRAFNSGLKSIRPVASYSCRPRNNRPGARLSEHSYGNAVDIAGFTADDGRKAEVLDHWNAGGPRQIFLRSVWKSACGPFGTVLGPNSDRYHRDHFHFDVARYRSGPYCK